MNGCPGKVVLHIFLYCFFFVTGVYASPDTTVLPTSLTQELTKHRQQDDLEGWLYARIAYTDKAPGARIGFLMQSHQQAWRRYKTYRERLAWLDIFSLQGYYQLQTGNILASINAYEAALQFYESYPLPDADIIENVLKPLGNDYTRLADYGTALFIHRKTLDLALKQKKDRQTIASIYSNMAICARWQGELTTAMQYCRTGIGYAAPNNPLYGLLLSTEADILTGQGSYDSAYTISEKALRQLQQYKKDTTAMYWYASTLQVAARAALTRQQQATARQYAIRAQQVFGKYYPISRQREKAKVWVLLADIDFQSAQVPMALAHYHSALQVLLPAWDWKRSGQMPAEGLLYSENTLSDAFSGMAMAFQQLNDPQTALQFYMVAFMAEKKLSKQFFYADSKYKELQATRSRTEAAMKLAWQLWTSTGNKKYLDQLLLIAEVSRAQVLMDERQSRAGLPAAFASSDSLTKKWRQLQNAVIYYQHELVNTTDQKNITTLLQSAEYELSLLTKKMNQQSPISLQHDKLLTVEDVHTMLQQLPDGVHVLEFFAGKDSSFVLELSKTGVTAVHVLPQSNALQNEVKQFTQQWFAHGPSSMINDPRLFYSQCHSLYATLFKDIGFKQGHRYLLIPDGAFNYLPFDALLTDSVYRNNYRDWPYLCKQVSVSQAYSLQTFYEQQSARYAAGPFTGFFVAKGKDGRQPALSIEAEYQALKKNIAGNYYTDAAATWQTFNRVTDSAGILHISTHAVSSAADSFPYLQLYDKRYYLFDLRYKLFTPSLVVLGACKTADGLLLEGEGVNSLSRGFTAAGAGGVISGLWNMNDETTIELLQFFYAQLHQPTDAAMALHRAKQQWLQTKTDNNLLQLPYYWAGFIYSGHLKEIEIKEVKSYRYIYWLAAVPVLFIIIYFVIRSKRRRH